MSSPSLEPLLQAAIVHHQSGRLVQASEGYGRVLRLQPHHFQALHLAGAVALQRGEITGALDLLGRALRAQPKSAPTLMCLGLAYSAAGKATEAESCLRGSLKLEPKNAETWGNLGAILVVSGRIPDAVEAFRTAVKLNPRYAQGWTGLGSALLLLGEPIEALACHERTLKLDPAHLGARYGRAQALLACQRIDEAERDFAATVQASPENHHAHSYWLFTRNYSSELSAAELFRDHAAYGQRVRSKGASPRLTHDPDPDRRLRLAFLSPDLRSHSIAYFLEPLLRHLDPTRFEVLLYHDYFKVDAVSERLKSYAALWRNFVGQPDSRVEAQIRDDAPDVLVDLSGHCSLNRLPLYARRLAPVQLNYLGYPNTTGLAEMDYRLTDEIADPSGVAEALHTEKLVRFAPTAWAYAPPPHAPAVAPPPCLPGHPVTFGSFNLAAKLNDFTLQLWGRILAALPGSRLILKSYGLDPVYFRSRLERLGLPVERIELLCACASTQDHLACYGKMDIALDPYPYAGTTTTCEALWMGRPVITLAGDRHASRVGASLLRAIGKPEWIARSADEYVDVAVRLASSANAIATEAETLRARMSDSDLLDHAAQSRRFATTIRELWRVWASSRTIAPTAA